MSTTITDDEILTILRERAGGINPTYYIKNVLRGNGHFGIRTPLLRRRLAALEKAGQVARSPASRGGMICWNIVPEAVA